MSNEIYAASLRELSTVQLGERLAKNVASLDHHRYLRSRDSKQWTDEELLAFMRQCLRRRGSTVHDEIEPAMERELDRRIEKNEEHFQLLIDILKERDIHE